ncbi:MAG: extensin, partial [Xanthobacteraceae bacterium]|nr:extensin [Xanthobacteraceae bacterium]
MGRRFRSIRRRQLRCNMAEAVAQWIRAEVGPAAAELGAPLTAVTDVDSYQCRGRNNVPGAKLSEHGRGNALDISAIKLGNGALFNLTDPLVSKPFREQMRALACGRFTTVLGPGSDAYHSDHIHLDLAER